MLVPLGDLGFRAAMATAFWGACAMALLCQLSLWINTQTSGKLPAIFAIITPALCLTSATMIRSFTETEVYASALFFSLLAAGIVLHPTAHSSLRWRLIAGLCGLSLLVHTSVRIGLVAAVALLLLSPHRRALRARAIVPWSAALLSTALVVLYFPLRAAHTPWADWGTPQTLGAVLNHLSASRIRQAYSQQMFAWARVIRDGQTLRSLLVQDLTSLTLLLALSGAVLGLRARSRSVALVSLLATGDLLYALLINPMGARDRQTLFLAEASIAMLAVYAVQELFARLPASVLEQRWARWAVSATVVLTGFLLLIRTPNAYKGSVDGWSAVEYFGGSGAIGAAPARAIVLCESDDLCGASLYARVCEGERPDVVVLPRQHLWERSVWRRLSVVLGHPPNDRNSNNTPNEGLRVRRMRQLVSLFGERIRWEQGDLLDERLARINISPSESPVLARVSSIDQAPHTAQPTAMNIQGPDSVQAVSQWLAPRETQGALSQQMAANILFAAGMRHASVELTEAEPYWLAARQHDPTHAGVASNLAVVRARQGRVSEAIALCELAIELDPQRAVAWRNLRQFAASQWTAEQLVALRQRAQQFGIELEHP
jgi:hypothetical protein